MGIGQKEKEPDKLHSLDQVRQGPVFVGRSQCQGTREHRDYPSVWQHGTDSAGRNQGAPRPTIQLTPSTLVCSTGADKTS